MTDVKCKSSIYGEMKVVVSFSPVNLKGKAFLELQKQRRNWVFQDRFCNPGPIQFTSFGKLTLNKTLRIEHENYSVLLGQIEEYCEKIKSSCRFGSHENILNAAKSGLQSLNSILELMKLE